MDIMEKSMVFVDFGQNYPRKWPLRPPGGESMDVKTIEMDHYDPYVVTEVV